MVAEEAVVVISGCEKEKSHVPHPQLERV
jgi:hypothetical protein